MKTVKTYFLALGAALIVSSLLNFVNTDPFMRGWFSCMAFYMVLEINGINGIKPKQD